MAGVQPGNLRVCRALRFPFQKKFHFFVDNLCVVNYFHTHEGEIVMSDLQFQANPVYQDDGVALVPQVRV